MDPIAFDFNDPEQRAYAMARGMANSYRPALEDQKMKAPATQVPASSPARLVNILIRVEDPKDQSRCVQIRLESCDAIQAINDPNLVSVSSQVAAFLRAFTEQ